MECKVWRLERYARMTSQPITGTGNVGQDGWEHFDNKKDTLELTLTSSNHLLIHHGRRQLESISLTGSDSWIKGISKGDSTMVVMKAETQSRRFRIKFSPTAQCTGDDNCRACVETLSKYFPIKIPDDGVCSQQIPATQTSLTGSSTTLVGDVTLRQLADTICNKSTKLPDIYARFGDGTQCDLGTLIKLCLTDSSFPAFVDQVEKELEIIKNESA
ncbi:meiotic recombination protein REC114-like [Ruditapes philippinarum]|uniref:meiotic recombination protein REC114-like n=1 Tax=Ruditapes philippinarum TaxID=129788 RepID=UPI00295C32D6|nr:meiotic recombination protein REC114-like [Ruditapes philippinarum]